MPTSSLLAALLLGGDRGESLSRFDCSGHRNRRRSSLDPANPRSVELRAGNDDDGGGGKIDWNPRSNPKISQLPSYSDDWLLNFHNWDQSEKQLVTNSLANWNEEIRNEQATIIEWQDSFQRNDLADFTPPMSDGLNCLMVGEDFGVVDDDGGEDGGSYRVKLPWEEESGAQITTLRVLEESAVETTTPEEEDTVTGAIEKRSTPPALPEGKNCENTEKSDEPAPIVPMTPASEPSPDGTDGSMVRTELVPRRSSASTTTTTTLPGGAIRVQDSSKQAAAYDCIVDQGLLDRILPLENGRETVRELLEEAAVAIKDLGIYVLVTKEMTEESREMLSEYGLKAGLEWQFELDGISDDTQVVSVARRFCTGEMPKVGRLSRFQPDLF